MAAPTPYAQWQNGPPHEEDFFPIAVWLQPPDKARQYLAAGFNTYIGLWNGPTDDQLATLKRAGMKVFCEQNETALKHLGDPNIIGWMHGDEPDNAQSLGQDRGYGPPIPPEKIFADYKKIQALDPSRPVLLNLGQGVAWDNYIGRGVRRNHPEDYPEYLKGCDLASFDIYPVVHDSPEISGKLEFVARGVERLGGWTRGEKPVWNCIECTHISNPRAKATPGQIRAEVWMALVHGSRGLIYFVHQFKPESREAALLDDPETLAAVTAINREVRELAPALNSPNVVDGVAVSSAKADVPVAAMMKRAGGSAYLFAVNLRNESTRATFSLREKDPARRADVLDESRSLAIQAGRFSDDFTPYAVHLYQLRAAE